MKNRKITSTITQQELLSLSPQYLHEPLSKIEKTKKKITATKIAI